MLFKVFKRPLKGLSKELLNGAFKRPLKGALFEAFKRSFQRSFI
jgi:hypothetical protein